LDFRQRRGPLFLKGTSEGRRRVESCQKSECVMAGELCEGTPRTLAGARRPALPLEAFAQNVPKDGDRIPQRTLPPGRTASRGTRVYPAAANDDPRARLRGRHPRSFRPRALR